METNKRKNLMSVISIERRNMNTNFRKWFLNESAPEVRNLTSSGTGYIVPQEIFGTLAEVVKAYAPIVDVVTAQENTTGRPTQFVTYDPTGNALLVQAEGVTASEQDFTLSKTLLNHDLTTAATKFSNQLLSDSPTFDLMDILKRSATKQMGRTIDYSVIAGTDPAGGAMTNGANLLANSPVGFTTATLGAGIGWTDITSLISSVNSAFLPNASFVLSYGTYINLLSQKTTTGAKLYPELVDLKLGSWPVIISAAMPQTLVANNVQLLFGDLSQVGLSHTGLGIQVLRQRYTEYNMTGLIVSSRVASTLMVPGAVKALKLAAS
jgi:HK97 family phage major capsid protein